MYTANTMASAIEALGMSLPYDSSIPAEDPLKKDECRMAGRWAGAVCEGRGPGGSCASDTESTEHTSTGAQHKHIPTLTSVLPSCGAPKVHAGAAQARPQAA
jgi:hypothetical protein